MSSLMRGRNTSEAEVTHISPNGVWLLSSSGKELFMPCDEFPWFKDQPVRVIYNLEEPSPGHFYWPDIDLDLSEKIMENPDHYPHQASHNKQSHPDA